MMKWVGGGKRRPVNFLQVIYDQIDLMLSFQVLGAGLGLGFVFWGLGFGFWF